MEGGGGSLKSGTKTQDAVELGQAEKIYLKLVKSKILKGYKESVDSSVISYSTSKGEKVSSGILPQLLNELKLEDQVFSYLNEGV